MGQELLDIALDLCGSLGTGDVLQEGAAFARTGNVLTAGVDINVWYGLNLRVDLRESMRRAAAGAHSAAIAVDTGSRNLRDADGHEKYGGDLCEIQEIHDGSIDK